MRAARLPEGLKPDIRCEEMFASNAGVLRGERGQRAGTVGLGRLGEPCRRLRRRNKTSSETISCLVGGKAVGQARSSDEAGQRLWSEGAMAGARQTQRGLDADWGMSNPPTTGKLEADV